LKWEPELANCPKCGKPLKKGKKSEYFCENDACSVIFVVYPEKESIMRVAHKAHVGST
jgi:hypothetical protein